MAKASDQVKDLLNYYEENEKKKDKNQKNLAKLAMKVWTVTQHLKNEIYSIKFLACGGVILYIKLMKVHHKTVQKEAINGLLSCFSHLPVLGELPLQQDDGDLFIAVVDLTYLAGGPYNVSRITAASSILNILIHISKNGAKLFNEAVKITAKRRNVHPYSHFVSFLKNGEYFQETLCLLECAMRSSVLFSFADEMISFLEKCNIEEAFGAMKNLNGVTDNDTIRSLEMCKFLFGDKSQRVSWCQLNLPCFSLENQVNAAMKGNVALDVSANVKLLEVAMLRKVKRRIASQLEVQMAPYDKQLERLEKNIEQEHSENLQQHGLGILSERNKIRADPIFWCFYQSLQLNLNHVLVALQCIKSGMIEQADAKTITISGEIVPLPGVGVAATIINNTLQWYIRSKRKKQNAGTSTVAFNSGVMEEISEACARVLTFRYAEQLNVICREGAKSLGAYGARLILEAIRCGSLGDLDAMNGSKSQVEIVTRLVDVVGVELPENSKSKFKFLKPKEKKVCLRSNDEKWGECYVFTKPGLQVNKCFYDGACTDSLKYGYRLGSMREVEEMKLSQSSARVMSPVQSVSFSDDVGSSVSSGIRKTVGIPMKSERIVLHQVIEHYRRDKDIVDDDPYSYASVIGDNDIVTCAKLHLLHGEISELDRVSENQAHKMSSLKEELADLVRQFKTLI